MKKKNLLPKLIFGIAMGITIGLASSRFDNFILVKFLSTTSSLFGNFLTFIIPCIILAFVAPGIADLGKKATNLLGITAAIAYLSTITAGILAFFIGSAILPNVISKGEVAAKSLVDVTPYFTINMPPVFGVMTALVFSFLLGIGMSKLKSKNLLSVTQDFQKIINSVVTNIIVPFIPFHIAGIFAKISATGEIFKTMKTFSSVFIMIIVLQLLFVILQYLIAYLVSKKSPLKSIQNMLPAYFTALGTQSSAATIPVSLECSRENGVKEDVLDFVVPLCATIHLAGDTITLVLASMGVMLMSGTEPSFGLMLPFILMLGVTMVAAPGIPGGGVMAALGLLERMLSFGATDQALMIAIHFSQDSFGTAANVTGDGAIAIMVDKYSDYKDK